MTDIDLTHIRQTARFHLACMFIEKLRRESRRRVVLRHCSQPVYEIATWLDHALGLDEPPHRIDDMTVAVALNDTGFDLRLTARGQLLTNCSAEAMHRYARDLQGCDEPLERRADGTWHAVFPRFDMRWPERLARIDAEIAARALH